MHGDRSATPTNKALTFKLGGGGLEFDSQLFICHFLDNSAEAICGYAYGINALHLRADDIHRNHPVLSHYCGSDGTPLRLFNFNASISPD